MTSGQRVLRDHYRGVIEFDSSVTAEPIALQALTRREMRTQRAVPKTYASIRYKHKG
jgi:hypothetical protein